MDLSPLPIPPASGCGLALRSTVYRPEVTNGWGLGVGSTCDLPQVINLLSVLVSVIRLLPRLLGPVGAAWHRLLLILMIA